MRSVYPPVKGFMVVYSAGFFFFRLHGFVCKRPSEIWSAELGKKGETNLPGMGVGTERVPRKYSVSKGEGHIQGARWGVRLISKKKSEINARADRAPV